MNNLLNHRGPDDEGYVCILSSNNAFQQYSGKNSVDEIRNLYSVIDESSFEKPDIVLAHKRLSIIDLSPKGHCPMSDENKKIWITYNGEIYNYIELRNELISHGYKFFTGSDTEVIINSYLHWGKDCLTRFNGMWAFALWDSINKELFLARDRFGVKPLYYSHTPDYFAFSSEIKPLLYLNENRIDINISKISFFILYGNRLNDNRTYINGIESLKPSHYAILKDDKLTTSSYYNIKTNSCLNTNLEEEFLSLLKNSIELRYRSDVPVGVCLSGGFDSSSIVALSNEINRKELSTFSAVWDETECDESKYIDVINSRFKCIPNKIKPSVNDFAEVFEKISYYQEVPTEGPGLYPQWFVMQKAHGNVKVLLDGQGGDEVTGGYFHEGHFLRKLISEHKCIKLIASVPLLINYCRKKGLHYSLSSLFPGMYNKLVREKLSSKKKILNKDIFQDSDNELLHLDVIPPKIFSNYIKDLSYHYIMNVTIPTLLHYEDRSSMAHSIESRVPFLDYRLVEFMLNIPDDNLIYKITPRRLYRSAMRNFLPVEIIQRKDKFGYPTPFVQWSRTILKSYINDTLLENDSRFLEFINRDKLELILKEHYSRIKDYSWDIWRYLSLKKFLKLTSYNFR